MAVSFQRATKKQAKARIGLVGPAGSGKTYSALAIAGALGARVAVLDTERGSASKYSNLFPFDVVELESYSPERYVEVIKAAEAAGYDVLVIDSLSHAWVGKDGALEQVDRRAGGAAGSFGAWRQVTPMHNALVDAMLSARLHIIATLRSKTEWVLEEQEKGGRKVTVPRKVGMAPIQREGLDYEFDVVGDLDVEHNLTISKSRCPDLANRVINRPGGDFAGAVAAWLSDGAPAPAAPAPALLVPAQAKPAEKPLADEVKPIAPMASVDLVGQLSERMKATKSQTELDAVASEVGAAVKAGKITAEERKTLLGVYEGVSKQWSQAA